MAQQGTASGRLTSNGETVALEYAYANAQPGFFDESSEDVRVLLSDMPLPEAARTDVFERIHMGRDGAARIVEVVVDAERRPSAARSTRPPSSWSRPWPSPSSTAPGRSLLDPGPRGIVAPLPSITPANSTTGPHPAGGGRNGRRPPLRRHHHRDRGRGRHPSPRSRSHRQAHPRPGARGFRPPRKGQLGLAGRQRGRQVQHERGLVREGRQAPPPAHELLRGRQHQVLRGGPLPFPEGRFWRAPARGRPLPGLAHLLRRPRALLYGGRAALSRARQARRGPDGAGGERPPTRTRRRATSPASSTSRTILPERA